MGEVRREPLLTLAAVPKSKACLCTPARRQLAAGMIGSTCPLPPRIRSHVPELAAAHMRQQEGDQVWPAARCCAARRRRAGGPASRSPGLSSLPLAAASAMLHNAKVCSDID